MFDLCFNNNKENVAVVATRIQPAYLCVEFKTAKLIEVVAGILVFVFYPRAKDAALQSMRLYGEDSEEGEAITAAWTAVQDAVSDYRIAIPSIVIFSDTSRGRSELVKFCLSSVFNSLNQQLNNHHFE